MIMASAPLMIAAGNISMAAVNHLDPNVFNLTINISFIIVFGIILLAVESDHFLPTPEQWVTSGQVWFFWI